MAKKLYELTRPLWDGKVIHDKGTKLYFEEDKGPKHAVLAELPPEPELEDEDAPLPKKKK